MYFGARYYDPDTARFITQDTYLGEQGTPPSLHRYLYAYSNPTVYIDLEGYESLNLEWGKPPEKSFFDSWIFDKEHAKDIYRGMVNSSPVGHYKPESARVDATMDLVTTSLETVIGGKLIGTGLSKLKQPAINLIEKIADKMPEVVKATTKTAVRITTEIKDGAQKLGVEILEKTAVAIKNTPLGNIKGQVVLRHVEEGTEVVTDAVGNARALYPEPTTTGVRWRDPNTGRFAHTPEKGITALGHYSYTGLKGYAEVAESLGANYYQVSNNVWSKLETLGRKEAFKPNQVFLDEAMKRGDEIVLTTPLKPGTSYFRDELEYLANKGVDVTKLRKIFQKGK